MLTKKFKKLIGSICYGVLLTSFCGIIAYADGDASVKQFSAKNMYDFGVISDEETDEKEVNCEIIEQSSLAQYAENNSLPSSVDLSQDAYFPPIRAQIGSSSAAWATTYYQFTYEVARYMNENGAIDWTPSTDDSKVFSPKYTWNFLNSGKDQGINVNSIGLYYRLLKEFGSLKWSQFPQTSLSFEWYKGANDTETRNTLKEALDIRVKEAHKGIIFEGKNNTETAKKPVITSYDDDALNTIKSLLNEGHPLVVSTDFSTIHCVTLSNGEYGCPYVTNGDAKQAVTIVGYDDNIWFDISGDGEVQKLEKGAFKVANSWGTDAKYHNDGFIWIMYDALNMVSKVNAKLPKDIQKNRTAAFYNDEFYYIEVEKCTNEMLVEVEIEASDRSDISITLESAESVNVSKSIRDVTNSILSGSKSFNGNTVGQKDSRIFLFDYGNLYKGDNAKYWLEVYGTPGKNVALNNVKWYKKDGTVLNSFENLGKINGSLTLSSSPLPFEIHIKTGVTEGMTVNELMSKIKEKGHYLTAYEFNNSQIPSPSTTKVATGMKIIKTNSSTGKISDIYYVVLFGDVNGDGSINSNDSLAILNDASGKTPLGGIAKLAADTDCNGTADANDSLNILKSVAGTFSINQNWSVEHYPAECYIDSQFWM